MGLISSNHRIGELRAVCALPLPTADDETTPMFPTQLFIILTSGFPSQFHRKSVSFITVFAAGTRLIVNETVGSQEAHAQ